MQYADPSHVSDPNQAGRQAEVGSGFVICSNVYGYKYWRAQFFVDNNV